MESDNWKPRHKRTYIEECQEKDGVLNVHAGLTEPECQTQGFTYVMLGYDTGEQAKQLEICDCLKQDQRIAFDIGMDWARLAVEVDGPTYSRTFFALLGPYELAPGAILGFIHQLQVQVSSPIQPDARVA